ncbi:MAG: PIN domain-containing protein [Clostridiales Family XIII bacterium]|jgi:predicted nucleic acid-binding protein|nr:PIN domain-containing protein [Clostridiales Family XIII bacterium]
MTNRLFIDSNIWVYALSGQSEEREQKARAFISNVIIDSHPVISYQVVNETMRVLKKLGKSETELRKFIDNLFDTCEVVGFTKESALLASELRETMSVSYWDSQIVASAYLANCSMLVSEDMHDGSLIRGSLTIKNIFNV